MAKHNELGNRGEEIAKQLLVDKGHAILETNYRFKKAEIDLISLYQNTLIFTEVKTRSSDFFGAPELAVSEKKQQLIIRAAQAYLYDQDYDDEIRFDVISIVIRNENNISIKHFEDAFFPGLE